MQSRDEEIGQAALEATSIIPMPLDGPEVPDVAKAAKNGGVWPKFYMRPVLNRAETEKKGRPIHDQVEYIEIIVAGDRNSKVNRPVREDDKYRWPQHWQAFKSGEKMPIQGTPLEQWTQLGVDQVADLKSLGILTVEMLADLSDDQVQNYGLGGHKLRELAQGYIEKSQDAALPQHQAAEISRQQEKITEQEDQITELKAAVKQLQEDGGGDPEMVQSLENQLEQSKMMIETLQTTVKTQDLALETLKQKVDEMTMANGQLKAELEKAQQKPQKKPAPKKKTAATE